MTRYDLDPNGVCLFEDHNGEWVLYIDHKEEAARLRLLLGRARDLLRTESDCEAFELADEIEECIGAN